jgi:type I restriction enzyme S subunit
MEGANISRDSARISLVDPTLRDFVALYLESTAAQTFVMNEMRGLAVRGINIEDLRRLPVPMPPEAERDRTCRTLHSIKRYLRALEDELDGLRALRRAMVSEFLSGALQPLPEHRAA